MTTTLVAPAKLTLGLRITGRRHDGYHLIDAEMVSLDLHDNLTVDTVDTLGRAEISVVGRYAPGVPTDARNLVASALRVIDRRAHVTIDKRIPPGGGLGGGSSDAAAVLRWGGVTDLEVAAGIGADVAFCLVGGRARVRGIGEIVEPLPHVDLQVTLVTPPLAVNSAAAYRAWDDLGGPRAPGPNDLEPAAIAVVPELARWRDRIHDLTGQRAILAGSGATWFVHGEHSNALAVLSDEGAMVVTARTVPAAGNPA